AIALNNGGLNFADLFVEQHFMGQLSVEDLLADFGHALGTKRVRGARPAQRRLRLLIRLEQRLVGPLRRGRRIRSDPVEAVKNYPRAPGSKCRYFLHILYWLVHVFSLSGWLAIFHRQRAAITFTQFF